MTSNQEINREVSIKCTSVTVEDRNYTRDKLINGRDTQNGPILFSLKKKLGFLISYWKTIDLYKLLYEF